MFTFLSYKNSKNLGLTLHSTHSSQKYKSKSQYSTQKNNTKIKIQSPLNPIKSFKLQHSSQKYISLKLKL